MVKEDLKDVIKRVGTRYVRAPKSLRITIGEILAGKIELNYEKNKKSDRL